MHEFGLCEGVLDAVRTRAAGREVAAIRLRCGVRHAVDSAAMTMAFGVVAEGTEAAGATVDVVTVPAVVTCRECGYSGETTDLLAVCPRCASADVALTGGEEMILESVRFTPVPSG
jgi:hydrogenase nickel incorporation protein HypA/HybF